MSFVKIVVLFRVDTCTEVILKEIQKELCQTVSLFPQKGTLPLHMTIIGGGVVSEEVLCKVVVRVRREVIPFRDNVSPKVAKVETAFLPGALGVRLVFPKKGKRGYVVTGDREKNEELLKLLQTSFRFDGLPRHVTLGYLSPSLDDSYKNVDTAFPLLEKMIKLHQKELLAMKLIPEIWIKREGGMWQCAT